MAYLAISNNGVFAGSALPLPFTPVTMCWVMKLPLNTALYNIVLLLINQHMIVMVDSYCVLFGSWLIVKSGKFISWPILEGKSKSCKSDYVIYK